MSRGRVRIGKIVGCHGLRGDVKVRAASEDPAWIDDLEKVYFELEGGEPLLIEDIKPQGTNYLFRFEGKTTRNDAEALVGKIVYADADDLPEPEEGEFWADDLIGLDVIDRQNQRKKGVVKDLLSSAGTDYLEIQLEHVSETVVVPFIERFFPEVDLEKKIIYVDLLSDFIDDPGHAALKVVSSKDHTGKPNG